MDFNKFIIDTTYVKDKINKNLNITSTVEVTVEQIKELMSKDIRRLNIPRETKPLIEAVKPDIQAHPKFTEAVDVYNKLLKLEQQ